MPDREPKLTSPWEMLRDLITWLPSKDAAIAMRIIDHHERQHVAAANLEIIERAD